ncbi:hypothetical protein F1734_02080 [Rhodococcus ruber]|uniref:hypothetical protein n=1 Tax=Rhodococcus TaxID=1827 RepID=UPI001934ADF0|nr:MULTISPECIES: hypothetical protein [Rhodococcus]QRE79165.1 hypothetical protein F1734_02080 [Rhodococcus ruber]WFS11860.1 hypothetical protein P9K37_18875 [Rhodococcus aetherivorans]
MQRFEDTPFAKEASNIGAAFARAVKDIRSDEHLSDEGKRAQLEAAYKHSSAQMDKLRSSTKLARENRITVLQRMLFGTANGAAHEVISYRDASDRASAVANEAEAITMMNNAVVSGDRVLQGALLRRAYAERNPLNGRPWMDVINTYEKARPFDAEYLQELLDLSVAGDDSFARALHSVIPRPIELDSWG